MAVINSQTSNKISLIGFMGSGKSTIGKEVAALIKYTFIDIDECIVKNEGKSIHDIFMIYGELYFRQLESTQLKQALKIDHCIISCGGGIVESVENRVLLKENSKVFWLRCGLQTMLKRCIGSDRPLLQVENPYAQAQRLLNAREYLYATTAHHIVDTDSKLIATISNEIYRGILAKDNRL